MTTPTTAETLDQLRAAYLQAVPGYSVTFQDTTVVAQRLENLRREIEHYEAKLAEEAAATAGRTVRGPIYFDGGLR